MSDACLKQSNMTHRYCISSQSLKPGLHISRKDRKHMVGNVYFKMYGYGLLCLSLE